MSWSSARAATFAWQKLGGDNLPPGFASGNGRIEAVEIDIATKTPGRIQEILFREGDFVTVGQVLARMDTTQLHAQLRQAEAQLRRAIISVDTAKSLVAQREAERKSATAVIAQRSAELDTEYRKLQRSEQLIRTNAVPQQVLDDDRAAAEGAKAAVAAAEAQRAAAEAAISSARAQVVDAEASIDAGRAAIGLLLASEGIAKLFGHEVDPNDMEVRRRPTEPKVLGGIDFDGSTPHTIPGRRSTIRCCCRRPSLTGSGLRRPMPASGSESPAASLQCSGPATFISFCAIFGEFCLSRPNFTKWKSCSGQWAFYWER